MATTTIRIREDTHKLVKIGAVLAEETLQEFVDKAVRERAELYQVRRFTEQEKESEK